MSERLTIALNMIVRNCEEHLPRTLESAEFVGFDQVVIVDTGSTDGTPEIAKKKADIFRTYTNYPKIEGLEGLSDFAGAREYARILSTTDYIFYLDADDVIYNPLGLKDWLEESIRTGAHDGFFMDYDYEHNERGNCVLRHQTVRCAERSTHMWRSPIHEVLCCLFLPRKCTVPGEISRVIHESRGDDRAKKSHRNKAVAQYWIERLGDDAEPRLWLNYGKSLQSVNEHVEAVQAFEKYLEKSGWNEERYFTHLLAATSCVKLTLFGDAYRHLFQAVNLFPAMKNAYIDLACCAVQAGDVDKAVIWAKHALTLEDSTGYQYNPLTLDIGPHRVLAAAYAQLGKWEESVKSANEVLKVNPHDRDILIQKVVAGRALRRMDLIESYKKVEFMISLEDQPDKIKALRYALPTSLENEPEFTVPLEVSQSRPRIAFFCGESAEAWSYDSHLEGGIGGSETAVIYMSQELAKLGWAVEVYALPSLNKDGLHEGVLWLPYWRYYDSPTPDVFISWRTPEWINMAGACKNSYVWLHDVQIQNRWRPEYWKKYRGVIFLSKAHRRTAPWIPEEKVWYSANGLYPEFHKRGPNNPERCIYASNPDRGLDLLLDDLWPKIKEAHPAAVLDICYGFTPLFKETMRTNPKYREIYNTVVKHLNDPGVNWHGRVGQDELATKFSEAGVWLYPTSFYEISCITAMQAQANGAVPCCTGFAALHETVRYGKVLGGTGQLLESDNSLRQLWLDTAISLIGNGKAQKRIRLEMIPWARKNFLWSKVAKEWSDRFQADLKTSLKPEDKSSTPIVESAAPVTP
jgi:glycosyltransferase involved in cell wall biosynthesis